MRIRIRIPYRFTLKWHSFFVVIKRNTNTFAFGMDSLENSLFFCKSWLCVTVELWLWIVKIQKSNFLLFSFEYSAVMCYKICFKRVETWRIHNCQMINHWTEKKKLFNWKVWIDRKWYRKYWKVINSQSKVEWEEQSKKIERRDRKGKQWRRRRNQYHASEYPEFRTHIFYVSVHNCQTRVASI